MKQSLQRYNLNLLEDLERKMVDEYFSEGEVEYRQFYCDKDDPQMVNLAKKLNDKPRVPSSLKNYKTVERIIPTKPWIP